MCIGTLVTRRLCSEGTKRFIRDCFVLRGHTERYQRFTGLRGHWYIIALRECSGISAGIPFGWPQVVVDWETVIWRSSFFPSTELVVPTGARVLSGSLDHTNHSLSHCSALQMCFYSGLQAYIILHIHISIYLSTSLIIS